MANGAGKTSVLGLLSGELAPSAGRVRHGRTVALEHLTQHLDEALSNAGPEARVLPTVESIRRVTKTADGEITATSMLERFGFTGDRLTARIGDLSGGELRRFQLLRLLLTEPNVLLLDEPTNDLDIETLELLEELVNDFPGTVLLVSHDRVFLDRVVTSTVAFEGEGRVVEYVGGYDDYLRQREPIAPAAPPPRSADSAPAASRRNRPRRLTFNEQRELEGLPEKIAALEEEQSRLKEEVASPEFYKSPADRIHTVLARIDAVHAELDAALERWVELDAIAQA